MNIAMKALERELLHSFNKGDQKAFELLFKTYYDPLCRYAFSFTNQKEAAEDLVKDMFLKLWEKKGNFEVSSTLSGYFFKSIRNACINYISREKEKRLVISENEIDLHDLLIKQPTSVEVPLASFYFEELEEKINVEIGKLPDQCQEIFRLSRFEDLSHKQIAEKLGISENTVKVQIYRALSKLKVGLEPYLYLMFMELYFRLFH